MYYGAVKKCDIANGPGVRVSLFVSGCRHHCKGCFQPETWSFTYGVPYTKAVEEDILKALAPSYIAGLTVLGGEPMEPENQPEVLELLRAVRERYPEKNVWCYSGYTYDTDLKPGGMVYTEHTDELLSLIDVLVDGEFVEEQKNIALKFRGSENQRLLDLRSSKPGRIALWEEDDLSPDPR